MNHPPTLAQDDPMPVSVGHIMHCDEMLLLPAYFTSNFNISRNEFLFLTKEAKSGTPTEPPDEKLSDRAKYFYFWFCLPELWESTRDDLYPTFPQHSGSPQDHPFPIGNNSKEFSASQAAIGFNRGLPSQLREELGLTSYPSPNARIQAVNSIAVKLHLHLLVLSETAEEKPRVRWCFRITLPASNLEPAGRA
ncbi:conserved hypothetical protein [Coccidioides posadasii str. Silveira]|uniref:Uncharacterized protein n=2 Tax=Coccidioides posadasii TaxID=199306 RepID=E9D9Y1_COCPS|nr:conserved hypothetical protein [Coccidioides posadasii str. Silveira]KMM64526.1 hypothetical protein CPAG_00878 [Coccidioides posadasii RMSCC 3488]